MIAVSSSVIGDIPSITTPKPKNDRSILADLMIPTHTLLLFNFDKSPFNKSVAGFNSITIH
jgi:hypothetical protein